LSGSQVGLSQTKVLIYPPITLTFTHSSLPQPTLFFELGHFVLSYISKDAIWVKSMQKEADLTLP